jgi:hypothetical protein
MPLLLLLPLAGAFVLGRVTKKDDNTDKPDTYKYILGAGAGIFLTIGGIIIVSKMKTQLAK